MSIYVNLNICLSRSHLTLFFCPHICPHPLTENGATGFEQAEVGPGFNNSSWIHRPLPVSAAYQAGEQAHTDEARSDLCGTVCDRYVWDYITSFYIGGWHFSWTFLNVQLTAHYSYVSDPAAPFKTSHMRKDDEIDFMFNILDWHNKFSFFYLKLEDSRADTEENLSIKEMFSLISRSTHHTGQLY